MTRALEFFSGLGGLHYGLEFADPTAQVVAAWDVNEHANACYQHNFGLAPLRQGIEYLDAKTIDKYGANCWLLSPPCQPYTRNGKELDDKDARAEGLLHLVQLLNEVKTPPQYIFVENVPNFETSRSREMLVETLDRLQYEIHEFLVSPMQVGVANDRKRYYLTARRKGDNEKEGEKEDLAAEPYLSRATFLATPNHPDDPPPEPREIPPIRAYLEAVDVDAMYNVPEHFITKRHKFRFDIVKPDSSRTSCFTKAYGSHHVIGSGSFLQTKAFESDYQPDDQQAILNVGLRFFTPTEVARLHAFPIDGEAAIHGGGGDATRPPPPHAFSFPPSLSLAQKWRLLGNSLNVRVVGTLIRDVLFRNTKS